MTEEKALRQSGQKETAPRIWHFLLPTQTVLGLLTAVLASAEPGKEREAHRGGGNGGKGCNLFLRDPKKRERGRWASPQPQSSTLHICLLPHLFLNIILELSSPLREGSGWGKCELKCPCYSWGSTTSFPLQLIYALTALPLIVVARFTVQDISITLLASKLRKAVAVLPGPYLFSFIHHYSQYTWHEWIKRNATILLVIDIRLFCRRSLYIFRWWKIF